MKKVLMISYYWPPSGGPGVQRILKFCKYLPDFGWEPIVLTVKHGEFPSIDESLILESASIKVYYAKAISPYNLYKLFSKSKRIQTYQLSPKENEPIFNKFSRWIRYNMVIPDGRIGWYPDAVRVGLSIIKKEKIDLIFSSGPPHTSHLIGRKLTKGTGMKWTADFRDPWTDRFYYSESPRNRLTQWFDRVLEKKVLDDADRISVVSQGFFDQLDNHTPIKDKTKIIFNGFDEEDFKDMAIHNRGNDNFVISHIGTLSRSQNPILLFNAILSYSVKSSKNGICLRFIGSVHSEIKETINKLNLGNVVEFIEYVPHGDAIKHMIDSDALLIVIPDLPDNKGIIPGKLYEYLRSGTQIILIGNDNCNAADIVKSFGGFRINKNRPNLDIEKMNSMKLRREKSKLDLYSRRNQTKILSEIFSNCVNT